MSSYDILKELGLNEARKLASKILKEGSIHFSKHAETRMVERNMNSNDVINLLRGGKIHEAPKLEHGSWRYRIETEKMTLVVAFRSESNLVVVSCWRKS